jgi:hypothetical protein
LRGWGGGGDAVVAVRAEPLDAREFCEPAGGAASGEDRHEVDRLGNQRTGDRDDGLLDELFEAA